MMSLGEVKKVEDTLSTVTRGSSEAFKAAMRGARSLATIKKINLLVINNPKHKLLRFSEIIINIGRVRVLIGICWSIIPNNNLTKLSW